MNECACREAGKVVVVATQMLESIANAASPTRAEAYNVATAVYDGGDTVMLSAESASGKYPVEAIVLMNRILEHTEADPLYRQLTHAVARRAIQLCQRDAFGAANGTISDALSLGDVTYTASGAAAQRI
nr:pyruvate kinase [Burkholderia stagnalis]